MTIILPCGSFWWHIPVRVEATIIERKRVVNHFQCVEKKVSRKSLFFFWDMDNGGLKNLLSIKFYVLFDHDIDNQWNKEFMLYISDY